MNTNLTNKTNYRSLHEKLVAEDVDVVARVDEEDGETVGIADGALLLGAGEPFKDVEVASVGGDGDEKATTDEGSGVADQRFRKEGTAADRLLVVGDAESVEEFVHEADVVVPFVAETFVAVVEVEHGEAAMIEAAEIACPDEFFFAFLAEIDAVAYVAVGGGVD